MSNLYIGGNVEIVASSNRLDTNKNTVKIKGLSKFMPKKEPKL